MCDDGDPCTDDTCIAGVGCDNAPKTGLEGLTCTCDRPLPSDCDGQTIPTRVQRFSARACRFFTTAGNTPGKRQRRHLRQGARALRRAIAGAVRAQLKGLAPGCAGALTERFRDAGERATLLAETL